jgi:apolipoprotein N-acyltransferase
MLGAQLLLFLRNVRHAVVPFHGIGYREEVRRLAALFILPAISGLLLLLSFPRFDLGFLAWIGLVPLLLAIRTSSWRLAFGQGFCTGLVFYAGSLSWVVVAMNLYGKVPLAVSYVALLMLAAYCALYLALFSSLLRAIAVNSTSFLLWTAPAVWVVLELIRTHLFTGFPWALLGYSQYRTLSVIQVADLAGVYGVSFLIVLVNVWASMVVQGVWALISPAALRVSIPWVRASLALVFVVAAVAYGHWRLIPHPHLFSEHTLKIGLVQPNVDQGRKWDVAFRRETIDRLERLTESVIGDVSLVVWPEAATPFLFEVESDYREELLRFVRSHGVALLFGSPAAVVEKDSNQLRLLNSAFLLTGDGRILDRYDKIHLVPFGEYIPVKGLLSFLDKLVVGIGDFLPGNAPEVMTGPGGQLGVVICFEVIFPDLVRQFVDRGADYMVTITNDAWFGRTSAPYQHFGMVVFRAIENRVYFARAANTGISGIIDPFGRILRMSDIFTEDALAGEIRTGGPRTFYTAYGDLFGYACVILALFSPILVRRGVTGREAVRARYTTGSRYVR